MVNENKMEIVIDKAKVVRDEIYDYNEMITYLDNIFIEKGCKKVDNFYIGAWEVIGGLTAFLASTDWFPNYVKVWKWYDLRVETDDPCDDDYYIEDVLEEYNKDLDNRNAAK